MEENLKHRWFCWTFASSDLLAFSKADLRPYRPYVIIVSYELIDSLTCKTPAGARIERSVENLHLDSHFCGKAVVPDFKDSVWFRGSPGSLRPLSGGSKTSPVSWVSLTTTIHGAVS